MAKVKIETNEWLDTAEAGKKLGLDPDSVKRYCNSDPPRLNGVKFGRSWMIHKDEIARYSAEESQLGRPKKKPHRRKAS